MLGIISLSDLLPHLLGDVQLFGQKLDPADVETDESDANREEYVPHLALHFRFDKFDFNPRKNVHFLCIFWSLSLARF